MISQLATPLLWVAITLPILIAMQRWIHQHLHGISLLVTGNPHWAIIVYALILLPGVALHELSHFVVARLIGVRTGKLSILPNRKANGAIQLGYVEYYKRDAGTISEALIGGAPLVFGSLAILLIGFLVFDLNAIVETIRSGDVSSLTAALQQMYNANDFLVWLYLLFAISNAMLPSPSDRRAWPTFFLLLGILAIILAVLGLGDVLFQGITGAIAAVFGYLGLAFSLAITVDLFFVAMIFLVEEIVGRIMQVELVYDGIAKET